MSNVERKEPYVYQPFGMQHSKHWEAQRIYGVAGVDLATINGLTKPEALAVLAALKSFHIPPKPPEETKFSNSCNRHSDCRAANEAYKAKHGEMPSFNFHCHSEDCEDCFGC